MSEPSSRSGPKAGDGLEVHLAGFLATFAKAGYEQKTQDDKRRAVVPFAQWVRRRHIAVADLDESCVGAFLSSRFAWECQIFCVREVSRSV